MKNIPRISEAEWQVMKVLWRQSPMTANAIAEALSATASWKPKTIKTLIARLVKKEAVGFEKQGREYNYSPLVKEADCVEVESRSFLSRIFDGATQPMLASFLEKEELSAAEIQELRKILDKKEGEE
ncbi:MAG: BlaI/MecI/CopY family transcriptional regulator [Planctomycetes bacterium]|nr:BlaI/MecI/CopY family transcriptional regulator [Planctomycetota bacterium]